MESDYRGKGTSSNAILGWKTMLQVRLELTTSASLAHILPYKYRALTDCATGAPSFYFRSLLTRPTQEHPAYLLWSSQHRFLGRALSTGAASPPDACEGGLGSAAVSTGATGSESAEHALFAETESEYFFPRRLRKGQTLPLPQVFSGGPSSGRRVGGLASRCCAGSGALPLPLPGSFSQRRRKARRLRVECGWWESLGGLRNP
nr:uncharacterized protein LOC129534197 [Gorilla gorilla gorilla]